jgi:hypothetical protein
MCANTGCNGNTFDKCNNKCSNNWVVAGNSCTPNAANNFYIFRTTNDLAGGNLTVSINNTSSSTLCPPFSLYGWYTIDKVSVTSA